MVHINISKNMKIRDLHVYSILTLHLWQAFSFAASSGCISEASSSSASFLASHASNSSRFPSWSCLLLRLLASLASDSATLARTLSHLSLRSEAWRLSLACPVSAVEASVSSVQSLSWLSLDWPSGHLDCKSCVHWKDIQGKKENLIF